MIEKTAVAASILLTAIIYGAFILTGHHSQPETPPPPEEPSILTPPEVVATTTEEAPEPEEKEPEAPNLPEGVICTDDCPLIDPNVVREKVEEYFADLPVMVEIARCESRFRQYDEDGTVLKNEQGSSATGVLQIMASYHRKAASRLGYDIDTLEGNLAYGRHLYEQNGTRDWNASRYCWGSAIAAIPSRISEL